MYDKIDADYTCQCDDSTPTLITVNMNSMIASLHLPCRVISCLFKANNRPTAVSEGSKNK